MAPRSSRARRWRSTTCSTWRSGISAGVGALVSAIPSLLPSHRSPLCLAILLFLTLMNLRGLRESGFAFMLPTYRSC